MATAAIRRRGGDEDEDEEAVIGAPALRHRHDRQPRDRRLRRHAAADHRLGHRRQRVDDEAGQDAEDEAEGGEAEHHAERPAVDLVRLRRRRRARPAEEGDAEEADEAGGGERRRQRQHGADGGDDDLEVPLRQVGAEQHRLEGEPLGDEAVERRQRRDRDASGKHGEGGPRHAVDEAAEPVHLPRSRRGQHRARAEEEERLEGGVVEDVEQRRGEGERGGARHAVGPEGEREAEADEDQADVLDGRIGEHPLQVVLHQGVEDAEHGGGRAEGKHQRRPPPRGRADEIEDDADEGVDRDLGHDAAHQRRDVARRGRMGERQPGVERHDAGLRAGAEDARGRGRRRPSPATARCRRMSPKA